jgi:hypothetical protein
MFKIIDNFVEKIHINAQLKKYRKRIKKNEVVDLVDGSIKDKIQLTCFLNSDIDEAERLLYLINSISRYISDTYTENLTQLWLKSPSFKAKNHCVFLLNTSEIFKLTNSIKNKKYVEYIGEIPAAICIGPIINPTVRYNKFTKMTLP